MPAIVFILQYLNSVRPVHNVNIEINTTIHISLLYIIKTLDYRAKYRIIEGTIDDMTHSNAE